MAEGYAGAGDQERRLTVHFAGWLGDRKLPEGDFFRKGLIVLDANVLLDLYRVTPESRNQVLDLLSSIAERLWVPNQAALEFSRNRKRVVEERISSFKQTKRVLQSATADAVDVIESAVAQLIYQRERNGTSRSWDVANARLDRESLLSLLDGIMDPALYELGILTAEHDLHPKDMQRSDPLLSRIDELIKGRIGPPYSAASLRSLVEHAHEFRFPNQIPPGFLDAGKETQVKAAGDFLLWRQTIDRAARMVTKDRLVLLITKDLKEDWWELDPKKRPLGPRPELVQELHDEAGADLLLLSLKEFVKGATEYLSSAVSDQTLHELHDMGSDIGALLPGAFRNQPATVPDLLKLSPTEFEGIIRYLLARLGNKISSSQRGGDGGIDFVFSDASQQGATTIVQVKRYRSHVGAMEVRQLQGILFASDSAQSAWLITTGTFSASAREAAQNTPVNLIDGAQLIQLLADIGIHVRLNLGPREA